MPKLSLVQHKARGSARARERKRAASELQIEPGDVGPPPEWLGAYGKDEWATLTGHGQYKQVLSPLHRGALLEYCILYNRMVMTETGMAGGNRITGTERQMLHSLRMQLGITPASSAKVKAPPAKPAKDEWAKFDQQA